MLWWSIWRLRSLNWSTRASAVIRLGAKKDPRALGPLLEAIEDEHRLVRGLAADALVKIGDRRALEPLASLRSRNQQAAIALAAFGDARAFDPVLALLDAAEFDTRAAAAAALGKLGDVRAVEPLIERLRLDKWETREAAATALGEIGDGRALLPLIDSLQDEDAQPRAAAAAALGRMGDGRAKAPLEAALEDEVDYVRAAAGRALYELAASAARRMIGKLRLVACREALDDCKSWSFYLLNDSTESTDSAVLYFVGYEWGDTTNVTEMNVPIAGLPPGGHALIWRDDDDGAELRIDLRLVVRAQRREFRLMFEFPKLYRIRELPLVESLGKRGYPSSAQEI